MIAQIKRALAALALGAVCLGPATAQDFRGLNIGDPTSAISALFPYTSQDSLPGADDLIATLFTQPDGAMLSVTGERGGRILYMESWNAPGTPASVGPGIRLGATTRAELAALAGSEGFYFNARGPYFQSRDANVWFLSYRVRGRTELWATFAFVAPAGTSQYAADGTLLPNPAAVLDSVILAHTDYLRRFPQDWGVQVTNRPGASDIDISF